MLAIATLGWLVGAYFAPSIVALARRSSRLRTVIVLDVFFGWSIVGWIWALALAVKPDAVSDEDAARIDEPARRAPRMHGRRSPVGLERPWTASSWTGPT